MKSCAFIVPAAGVGARSEQIIPKQYVQVGSQTILEHTVSRLLAQAWCTQVVVAVSAEDHFIHQQNFSEHEHE